ncbi:Hypothetical protein D9617_23g006270 [Elsinoe fawcettii]|nr:Hypothetical protein D9617_23g006270 [Elsinoe fawcettii]
MPTTDEDAAIAAIDSFASPSNAQVDACKELDKILSSEDPFIDVHVLFFLYNTVYFRSLLLPQVQVIWSPKLTLCAGICEKIKDDKGNNIIRLKLSEPLLKFRPRSDVIDTLLHEAIHAYFFLTTSWQHSRGDDGTGHGSGFLLLADAINNHGNYHVTVYHTFHDEVDSYRTHIWQCDGACRTQPPFFGLVKRSMNRPPGRSDSWYKRHQDECGGNWTKIAEPDMTKDQIMKMSGLQRAGLQKNKLDAWVSTAGSKRPRSEEHSDMNKKQRLPGGKPVCDADVACPICGVRMPSSSINGHLDDKH